MRRIFWLGVGAAAGVWATRKAHDVQDQVQKQGWASVSKSAGSQLGAASWNVSRQTASWMLSTAIPAASRAMAHVLNSVPAKTAGSAHSSSDVSTKPRNADSTIDLTSTTTPAIGRTPRHGDG